MPALNTQSLIIPCMRYDDAPAMIEWLCSTFGFERQAVYANEDGTIGHAQLTYGGGMLMLGSNTKRDSAWGRLVKQPNEIGGAETQCAYIVVSDADAVYAKAKAAGAKILIDIKNEDYGGRGFTCADPEGHIWNFGTYDPW
jgi:uncharacterized glyoxalase superfamily protein PhnB